MSEPTPEEKQIRETAKKWLESGEVMYVIGYEKAPNAEFSRPVFIYKAEDVDKLVWNNGCHNNLSLFLVEEMKKVPKRGETLDTRPVGIVVKPCDGKTIIELMKEKMVPRERAKIIALTCDGMGDPKTGELFGNCVVCNHHNPLIHDVIVGETKEEKEDNFDDIKDLEAMSTEELWAYWKENIDRCVRCYACRDACPLCYCSDCVFDRVKPYTWNEKSVKTRENMFYHIIRAMHLAARCTDCGECERVCPMDIPLRKLNRYLSKHANERFGIKAGENPDDDSVFGTYDVGDPGEEIW